MTSILLDASLVSLMQERGISVSHVPNTSLFPSNCLLESPCSLKWMKAEYSLSLGAFSYAVSGYFFATQIRRYCSIGEDVQVGRHSHPLGFGSTSPLFYLNPEEVLGIESHMAVSSAHFSASQPPTVLRQTIIEDDVYIGHGAFIMPGVRIGIGAVVGAEAVVTKDIPPYAVVVGSPAKIVRYRFSDETIAALLSSKWWEFSPVQLSGIDSSDPMALASRANTLRNAKIQMYDPGFFSLAELAAESQSS
jgi:acetyltransferase-like isoleucine patch superfamily enzyme